MGTKKPHTILIVEDDELLNEVLVQTLEDAGYRVITVYNGEAALDMFQKNRERISIVVSDIGLPTIGGVQLFEELQKIDPDIRVLLSSGFIDPAVKTKLLQKGARGIVIKPYEPNDILEKIQTAIQDG